MPNIIDVYSGVGGLSLGAVRAGFRLAAAVDLDPIASESHARNFPLTKHLTEDVGKLSGDDLLELAGLRKGALDGLVGGPPCQGFSHMGKRNPRDARNNLFIHFFRLVAETLPRFFLAENVPGILDDPYKSIRTRALEHISDKYVVLEPIKVRASDYGAPTTRTRVFFFGFKKRLFESIDETTFAAGNGVVPVTVGDALEGLAARIDPTWVTEEASWRKVGKMKAGKFSDLITGRVPKGIGDPLSLDRYENKRESSGFLATCHDPKVRERFAKVSPGSVDSVSRAPRLDLNGYCPTLRAGTGKDRGKYQSLRPIHPTADRVITPREAARLQGFPDWFVFHPTKWHSFRQIGNSVSPIVAERILRAVCLKMKNTSD